MTNRSATGHRRPIPHLRWWIGGMLFASTVINYIDRQTLSVLAPFLKTEYQWTNSDFALVVIAFRVAYAVGQTGAGKSILMHALALLCGARSGADVIRTNAEEASIEGWCAYLGELTGLTLLAHPVLDAFTVYGTQLLLPFSDYPAGLGSIFIIDPLFTVPLLAGLAAYRVGAGLVTMAVPAPLHSALAGQFPKPTFHQIQPA